MGKFEEDKKRREELIKKDIETAGKILKKYLKPVYEGAGEKWTEENDEDMNTLVKAISNAAILKSLNITSEMLIKVLTHPKE